MHGILQLWPPYKLQLSYSSITDKKADSITSSWASSATAFSMHSFAETARNKYFFLILTGPVFNVWRYALCAS